MEIVGHGIIAVGGEIDLVCYRAGNLVGNGDDQRIVGDITGVQHGLLVVEQQSCHASEVLTHDADGRLHGGGCDDRVT